MEGGEVPPEHPRHSLLGGLAVGHGEEDVCREMVGRLRRLAILMSNMGDEANNDMLSLLGLSVSAGIKNFSKLTKTKGKMQMVRLQKKQRGHLAAEKVNN